MTKYKTADNAGAAKRNEDEEGGEEEVSREKCTNLSEKLLFALQKQEYFSEISNLDSYEIQEKRPKKITSNKTDMDFCTHKPSF